MSEYTTKIRMDERIKSEVVTQYTTTDGYTYTDAIDAAQHQVQLDLCDLYQDPLAAPMDLADWCEVNAERLLTILQRLAEVRACKPPTPPPAPPRPGKKR